MDALILACVFLAYTVVDGTPGQFIIMFSVLARMFR